MDDIYNIFNTPQPIAYGGTGAATAVAGGDALSTKGADIVAAATTNIGAATGRFIHITGTATITSFDTATTGIVRLLVFDDVLTLTHNATSLILPGGASITTGAGDAAIAVSEGSGNWRVLVYQTADDTQDAISAMDARRNLWVNGSFVESQENGNTLGTTTGYYPADQVAMYFTAATAAMSAQRIQARSLLNALNKIEFKTTTAKASLGASDFVTLTQNIEGSSIAAAGFGTASAKPLVMRVEVTLPAGLYHIHATNSAANRHCAVPFTVAGGEANTPTVKTVTIPADTGGTWLTADGVIGLTVDVVLAAGATVTGGTASTWGATTYYAVSTQFNILSSTSNVARIADVGLKLDPDATGVYGAYRVGETDAVYRSERYMGKYVDYPLGITVTANRLYSMGVVAFDVSMAMTPTVLSGTYTVSSGTAGTVAIDTLIAASSNKAVSLYNSTGSWTATALVSGTFILSARLS